MPVFYHSEEISFPEINKTETTHWINKTIDQEKHKLGNINIIFVSDNYLLDLNKKHLSHDYFTDIITFDYCKDELISGDIYISTERVNENSILYKTTFLNELHRIIIHGLLHLLGFNDKTDEEKTIMTKKEDFYLNKTKNKLK